jgi:hypothetical protein
MSKIIVDGWEIPDHVSYSSFTTYLDCGWSYVLTRGAKVAEKPAWWFIGGNTVHEATEQLDRELCERLAGKVNG